MHTLRHAVAAVLVVGLVASSGVTPAVAQGDSVAGDIFDDSDDSSVLATFWGAAKGWADRARNRFSALGDETTAADAADGAQAAFNDHASDYQSYANERSTASSDANVLKVEFEIDDDRETRYVVADVNGSDYENVSAVASTDRSVDETCTLEGAAARNAADELDHFHGEFVEPNDDVTTAYMSQMAAEYGGQVNCSFALS